MLVSCLRFPFFRPLVRWHKSSGSRHQPAIQSFVRKDASVIRMTARITRGWSLVMSTVGIRVVTRMEMPFLSRLQSVVWKCMTRKDGW